MSFSKYEKAGLNYHKKSMESIPNHGPKVKSLKVLEG